jgi:hypothetical protein
MSNENDVKAALLIRTNFMPEVSSLIGEFTKNHKDNVTLAKVINAVMQDLTVDHKRFEGNKAQMLYMGLFSVLKANAVIRQDLLNKINSGEAELSEADAEKARKELA